MAEPPDERPRSTLARLAAKLRQQRRRDRWMLVVLIVLGGYLVFAMLPQTYLYLSLKSSTGSGAQALREARWNEAALDCGAEARIGAQLDRLFVKPYDAYVSRIRWGFVPPRRELFVMGHAAPRAGFTPRYLMLTVELSTSGVAEVTDASISGEQGQLANAKLWLSAACSKPAGPYNFQRQRP